MRVPAPRLFAAVLVAALLPLTAAAPAGALSSSCGGSWEQPQTTCTFDLVGISLSVFGNARSPGDAMVQVWIVEPLTGITVMSCVGEGGGGFAQCGASAMVSGGAPDIVPTPGMMLECRASGFIQGDFGCWSDS